MLLPNMALIWDQARYDNAYIRKGAPSYRRAIHGQDAHVWRERVLQLSDQLPQFTPAKTVLLVGCGFGWTIEMAKSEFGHSNIWGTDTSPFIQDNKSTEAVEPIYSVDIMDADAARQFRDLGIGQQGKFDWVISELVIESLDPDTELHPFLDACEALLRPQGNVAHIFAGTHPGNDDDEMIWRSLAEWVAERSSHYWLDIHDWQLGGGT